MPHLKKKSITIVSSQHIRIFVSYEQNWNDWSTEVHQVLCERNFIKHRASTWF